jgi:hypothetical protein
MRVERAEHCRIGFLLEDSWLRLANEDAHLLCWFASSCRLLLILVTCALRDECGSMKMKEVWCLGDVMFTLEIHSNVEPWSRMNPSRTCTTLKLLSAARASAYLPYFPETMRAARQRMDDEVESTSTLHDQETQCIKKNKDVACIGAAAVYLRRLRGYHNISYPTVRTSREKKSTSLPT